MGNHSFPNDLGRTLTGQSDQVYLGTLGESCKCPATCQVAAACTISPLIPISPLDRSHRNLTGRGTRAGSIYFPEGYSLLLLAEGKRSMPPGSRRTEQSGSVCRKNYES